MFEDLDVLHSDLLEDLYDDVQLSDVCDVQQREAVYNED